MNNHAELTDQEFTEHFENCSLNPVLFNHEAHLRLAWIHVDKYGVEQAIENISRQLKQYVTSLGAFDKYNETVTVAAIRAVDHFKRKSSTNNFPDFIAQNPRLKNNFKELLSCHYTTDIFTSKAARQQFLSPELLPF